jgi:hypothetical protein
MDDFVRFSLQIFHEDGPELLEWASKLPKNKVRRRSAIINMLKAGLSDVGARQASSVQAKAAVVRTAPTLHNETVEAGSEEVGLGEFDGDDLNHLFRPNGA